MAKIKVMVMRPTIFEVEAETFAKAKQVVIDGLINSRQFKPTEPIEFREIVEADAPPDESSQEPQTKEENNT